MYELRVLLPYLSDNNPNIEIMKKEIIEQAATGYIPQYAIKDGAVENVQLVKLE